MKEAKKDKDPWDQIGQESHPLKNHVILHHIILFLAFSATLNDWKNIRLVCKSWHKETLSRFRSTATLNLVPSPNLEKMSMLPYLSEFQNLESPYNLAQLPYRKYKLEDCKIDLSDSTENSFWTVVGPSIKHLVLKRVNFISHGKSPTDLLKFFVHKAPNLERLEMNQVLKNGFKVAWPGNTVTEEMHPNLVSLDCTDFWGFRFSSFPKLQDVSLTNCDTMALILLVSPNDEAVGDAGPWVISSVKRLNLMNTSIGYCPMISRRTGDVNVKFTSLEHLSLNMHSRDDHMYRQHEPTFLPAFLHTHCNTLRTLEIYMSCCRPPSRICPFGMAHFPALTELRIWGNVVNNLGFLKNMPNLSLLYIDLYNFEKQEKMIDEIYHDGGGHPATKLCLLTDDIVKLTEEKGSLTGVVMDSLTYFQINCPLLSDSVATLTDWMPNLKTLKAVLNTNTLPVVCEKWPQLEKLECLFGSSIFDENVTGAFTDSSEGSSRKGLVDLKHLSSFHYNTECNKSMLTDVSITKGFLQMRELTDLKICVSPEVTVEAEEALKAKIQNVDVYRNYLANEHHEDWECCRNKKYQDLIFNYKCYESLRKLV